MGKNTRLRLVSLPTLLSFFRALVASCVLYNRTKHIKGFSIFELLILVKNFFSFIVWRSIKTKLEVRKNCTTSLESNRQRLRNFQGKLGTLSQGKLTVHETLQA